VHASDERRTGSTRAGSGLPTKPWVGGHIPGGGTLPTYPGWYISSMPEVSTNSETGKGGLSGAHGKRELANSETGIARLDN